MRKSFSKLFNLYSGDGIQQVKESIRSDFTYKLNEISYNTHSEQKQKYTDDEIARSEFGVNDLGSGSNNAPTGSPPANIPPTETAGFGSKTLNLLKTAGAGLKKAGRATMGAGKQAVNFAAYGHGSGDDPREIAELFSNMNDPENLDIVSQLISQVPGITSNPSVGDQLIKTLSSKLGIQPQPVTDMQNDSYNPNGNLLTDNIFKKAGQYMQGKAQSLDTLKTAVGNIHQATGGSNNTSNLGDFISGKQQIANLAKNNAHDLFLKALRQPESLNDHPTWQYFMQTATPQQKQEFINKITALIQQHSGPTP